MSTSEAKAGPDTAVGPATHQHHGLTSALEEERREFSAQELGAQINHDYSTSEHGIVPLSERRPLWHFAGLWLTFCAGFSFMFVGVTIHDGGHGLGATVMITVLGCAVYFAYVMFAAYLGSRSGQTFTLLTRSIFGRGGSGIISFFLLIGSVGWCGFQANLLAQTWDGLYGWGSVELLGIILAFAMVTNNMLGFTGITVFARYIVTPIVVLWVLFLVVKGFTSGAHALSHTPKDVAPLGYVAGIGLVIGYLAYGSEPDFWRYGKPKFSWPAPAFIFAFVFGMLLFSVGGWMMAEFAKTSSFGAVIKYTTGYSLGGLLWLAFILATITQFATNDSNYYGAINALQNMLGGWRHWRRLYSCLIAAIGASLAAWLVIYVIPNGFLKLATFLAITTVSATVIMVIDHFVLPRWFKLSRSLDEIPTWRETAWFNWPGVIVLLIAVAFGGYASGIFPGENSTTYWWLPPVEAWALAGVGYLVAVAIINAVSADPRKILGFSEIALSADTGMGEIRDIASQSEEPTTAKGVLRPEAAVA
jgi:purine-cytosine permease-like protein